MAPSNEQPTWLGSDRLIARSIAQPLQRFLHVEASGGILLAIAAAVALVWANSPWSQSYVDLWHTELTINLGGHVITEDLQHWINDALMALFFFVIGLEIKQELVSGQLNSMRSAAIPIAGALGGMVLPAGLFLLLNVGSEGGHGWGIPVATDVAFALGVLALLGSRVPPQLKVLLLGLAIADDIGAIVVIAIFYSEGISLGWLALAGAGVVAVVALKQARVRYVPVYVVVGAAVWLATFESGVHATIAGVVLGLLAPAKPFLPPADAERIADVLSADGDVTATEVRDISFRLREAIPVTERIEDLLHPYTSYVIVPLFALANAGVVVSGEVLGDAAGSPVTLGVVAGLVLGKLVGVSGAIFLADRLGFGRLPAELTRMHIVGMAALAGIGFTVSIFVAGLAFDDPALTDQAKIGVLAASALAAALGAVVLSRTRSPAPPPDGSAG